MKVFLLLVALALGSITPSLAQTSLDPAFQPSLIYKPTSLRAVLQLSNGARVLSGYIRQASGQPANHLVRYLPNGTLDATFAANVAGYQWQPAAIVLEAPGGKLLLVSSSPLLRLGAVGTAPGSSLVRLNADGTPDASFATTIQFAGYLSTALVQPDGKVVVGGRLTALNGQPVSNLVRLNADGTLDASFQATGAGPDAAVSALALQPDGKLLVGGMFANVRGQAAALLVRLLPSGALDTSFATRNGPAANKNVTAVALQADGKVLISGYGLTDFGPGNPVRLTNAGTLDASFQAAMNQSLNQLSVQPDGRILGGQSNNGPLVRLLATGAPDPGFQVPAGLGAVTGWQLLPNGQVLVGIYDPTTSYATATYALSVSLLNSNGTRDSGFEPHLQAQGLVSCMALQADGKLLLGGDFDEVNGTARYGLARLNPTGTLDATYAPQAAFGTTITNLVLQPDGKLLVGGKFSVLGGSPRSGLARLLPSGVADASFAPAFVTPAVLGTVQQLALQPDGQVLIVRYATTGGFVRLTATGQPDPSFQPDPGLQPRVLLVQPDGKIVVSAYSSFGATYPPVLRLLPSGAADPAFNQPAARPNHSGVTSLARYDDGRLLVAGQFEGLGSVSSPGVVRLLADGTPDVTFSTPTPAISYVIHDAVIQPNGRIMVAGLFNAGGPYLAGTSRLLANGALDPSYSPLQGPTSGTYSLAIQPDGKILAAGEFTLVSGLEILCLTRLVDANVLAVKANDHAPALTAWPVPAREALHVQLDATAQPQRVQLLDALGRAVRTQAANSAALTLPTAGLAPGVYLLRVKYATGAATRRVVVE